MVAYKDIISSQQIWSLAFLILSDQMRSTKALAKPKKLIDSLDLATFAVYSDRDLVALFKKNGVILKDEELNWLRSEFIFSAKLPRKL